MPEINLSMPNPSIWFEANEALKVLDSEQDSGVFIGYACNPQLVREIAMLGNKDYGSLDESKIFAAAALIKNLGLGERLVFMPFQRVLLPEDYEFGNLAEKVERMFREDPTSKVRRLFAELCGEDLLIYDFNDAGYDRLVDEDIELHIMTHSQELYSSERNQGGVILDRIKKAIEFDSN